MVSLFDGYDVLWPVPTVSTAMMTPFGPPGIYAVPVLLGNVTTASPEVKTTHLWYSNLSQYYVRLLLGFMGRYYPLRVRCVVDTTVEVGRKHDVCCVGKITKLDGRRPRRARSRSRDVCVEPPAFQC